MRGGKQFEDGLVGVERGHLLGCGLESHNMLDPMLEL